MINIQIKPNKYEPDGRVLKCANNSFFGKNQDLLQAFNAAYIKYAGDESFPAVTKEGSAYRSWFVPGQAHALKVRALFQSIYTSWTPYLQGNEEEEDEDEDDEDEPESDSESDETPAPLSAWANSLGIRAIHYDIATDLLLFSDSDGLLVSLPASTVSSIREHLYELSEV